MLFSYCKLPIILQKPVQLRKINH